MAPGRSETDEREKRRREKEEWVGLRGGAVQCALFKLVGRTVRSEKERDSGGRERTERRGRMGWGRGCYRGRGEEKGRKRRTGKKGMAGRLGDRMAVGADRYVRVPAETARGRVRRR